MRFWRKELALILAVLAGACTDREPGLMTSPPVGEVAQSPSPGPIRLSAGAVRSLQMDDQTLIRRIQEAGGLTVVAFKAPSARRVVEDGGLRHRVPSQFTIAGLAMLRGAGAELVYDWSTFGMAVVRIPAALGPTLRANPLVDYVDPQPAPSPEELHASLVMQSAAPSAPPSTSRMSQTVPWGISMIRAPQAWYSIPFPFAEGKYSSIMIISLNGINAHQDLVSIPSYNCGGEFGACGGDSENGGTIYAGIAYAKDDGIGIVGTLPAILGDFVYSWRMCTPGCVNNARIQQNNAVVAAAQYGIKTVLAGFVSQTGPTPAEEDLFQSAWTNNNVIVVAAVGTNNGQVGTMYPASIASVVGVSGVKQDGTFATSTDCTAPVASNYGPMVDIAAPFSALTTSGSGSANYVIACGAGVGAAHVAAVAAVMKQVHPSWTAPQIVQALLGSASGGNHGDPSRYGAGIVDMYAAVHWTPPPPADPPLSVVVFGNDPIPPGQSCMWIATVYNGFEPVTYEWTADGQPVGDGSSTLNWTNSGIPYSTVSISVLVHDGHGRNAGGGTMAYVDPSMPTCYPE